MTSPVDKLHQLGQSIWYDNIQRRLLEDGTLAGMIARGEIRGVTSNPSIFHNAIAKSNDYQTALESMAWAGYSSEQIFDQLAVDDIRRAADLFRSLYEETNGGDGYVSLEVGPGLAHDTHGTILEAQRLWALVDRPNLMIKIPATQAGIPAIRATIQAGINVNVTLIFSLQRYGEVMAAYLAGLQARLEAGLPIDRIASVASFFISRVDSKVDKALENILRNEGEVDGQLGANPELAAELLGKAAIANARMAYAQFLAVFGGEGFLALKEAGGRVQRPLWASTSTKNPAYADVMYIEELIAPDTVNTVPQNTLDAYLDHGQPSITIPGDGPHSGEAAIVFENLETLGIHMDDVTRELEVEGVKAFSDAYLSLMETIEERRLKAVKMLAGLESAVATRVQEFALLRFSGRMFARDGSLWSTNAGAQTEIRERLGWLYLPETSQEMVPELTKFAAEVQQAGLRRALLLGMGGSSLASEVLKDIFAGFGVERGGVDFCILDSTDPAQVREALHSYPPAETLYIVSSKSGGTAEVNAFLDTFWAASQKELGSAAGEHFVAITDPGTSLEKLAGERGFRRIFHGDPTVGGRNSALSVFGLLPAALMGLDLDVLLEQAKEQMLQSMGSVAAGANPGLVLGVVLGEAALAGKDKLSLISDAGLESFGAWLEQLMAESTGKDGKGILPIEGESINPASAYSHDRIFVYLRRDGSHDETIATLNAAGHPVIVLPFTRPEQVGAEFYRWEIATAVASAVLGVNSFDQPDVQDNKDRTKQKIHAYAENKRLEEGTPAWAGDGVQVFSEGKLAGSGLKELLAAFLGQAKPGDYLAVNAYLPRNPKMMAELNTLRQKISEKTGLPVTIGFGPRFLHSTGQLHKGGPDSGMFILVTADPVEDLEIPGQGMSYGVLQRAQAIGDYESLAARGRRLLRVHLPSPEKVEQIAKSL